MVITVRVKKAIFTHKETTCNPLFAFTLLPCSGLVIGRLIVGLGVGASAIVVPAYLAEIAPAAKRGAVVQTYEVTDWFTTIITILHILPKQSHAATSLDALTISAID